jgi:hypothetical protein
VITGVPIDNGDGSYTFQTDAGELRLRGERAEQAFQTYKANAPSAAPPVPLDELDQAAARQAADTGPRFTQAPPSPRFQPPPTAALDDAATRAAGDVGPGTGIYAPAAGAYRAEAGVASAGAPFDPAAVQGFNRQDQARELADVRQRTAAALDPGSQAHGAAPSIGGKSTAELADLRDRPLPAEQPGKGQPAGKGGAVFYQPQPAGRPAAVGGGPAAKPGAPVPVSQTLQGTMPLTDAQAMEQKRAAQGRYEAAEGIADVEAKRNREIAAVKADMVAQNQRAEADVQAREAERQRVIGQKLAQVDQLAQEAAAGRVDPDHFWKDKGAETQFAAAILQGVSAWAEGMGGGKAYAIQNINQAIERDMRAQEINLQNKREALHAQTNLLGHLRQEFGDRDAAAAAFRATKLATAGAQLEEINARNLPEEQKAKLAEFAAALNADYTNLMQQAGKIAYSRTERFGGVGGPGGPTAKQLLDDAKDYGKEVEAAKLNESDASIANVEDTLAKYKGKDEVPGVGTENMVTRAVKGAADYVVGEGTGEKIYYNKEERANRQAVHFLKADLKHAITGAGMSDKERADLDTMIEGSKSYSDLASTTKIIKQRIARHRANLAGGHTPEAVELYELRQKAARMKNLANGRGVNIKPAGED